MIRLELSKKFKFDQTKNIIYPESLVYDPESILENKTQKILLDFEIQTDHLILARRQDQVIVNKKKKKKEEKLSNRVLILCGSGWPQSKTESKRKERKVPRPCKRTEKKR